MTVSVVIPTYNRAGMVPHAIESALSQRVHCVEVEIIVVDDGSTDDTRAVVERFGSKVRYVYQANRGSGAARNVGIDCARGDFIAFLDSDDRWYDFKLSMQLALFESYPDVGMVFTDFVIERADGRRLHNGCRRWVGRDLDFREMNRAALQMGAGQDAAWPSDVHACFVGQIYRQLLNDLPILTSSVVVRKASLDSTMRFATVISVFEDWEFFARVARRAPVGFIDAETTVNVGHADPSRLSHCSPLARARAYLTVLERVWLSDADFVAVHGDTLRRAHARALLAVARQAVLANEPTEARRALATWRQLLTSDGRGWAAMYRFCASLPGGRMLLHNLLRGQTSVRLLVGSDGNKSHSVNPAA